MLSENALSGSDENLRKFHEIREKYQDLLWKRAYRVLNNYHDAEEVTQDTSLAIFCNLEKIDDVDSLRTKSYLYTILNHFAYNTLRYKKKFKEVDEVTYEKIFSSISVRDESLDNILFHEIEEEMKKMPKIYSDILVQSCINGLSYQEISELLNISEDNVRQRYHRGKTMLQKRLGKYHVGWSDFMKRQKK